MTAVGEFPPLSEIEARLSRPDVEGMKPLRLTVLRNISVESIEPYLRYLACQIGYDAQIKFGDFDTLVQDAVGGAPDLFVPDLDGVLVFTPLDALSWDIARNFAALDNDRLEQEITRLAHYFETVVQGIRRQSDAAVLWHGLKPPLYPLLGIHDGQMANGQTATVALINAHLRTALNSVPNAYFVDTATCLARLGEQAFYDVRFWHMARAPYARQGLAAIAAEDFKFLRSLKGLGKKCLVLDCDDVLWGGVVGEDGLNGIKLGKIYPGSSFFEFQQEIVSLFHRGIMIALCSKNNENDVWEIFDHHPDMLLRREHIAAWRINWNDKASNIRELAEELNIGLDSMVFADDSPFDTEWVRGQIPEVETILLPRERPVEYRRWLASCGLFDSAILTNEDRHRGQMYRTDIVRRRSKGLATDLDGYLRSLEMKLKIGFGDKFTIPRIAQQTQKTNQFNLTTKRYTEADIVGFMNERDHQILWLKMADKFGDLGIVGSCIVRHVGDCAEIDTLLLSCRAIGRGVEKQFLSEVLHLARNFGARTAQGEFIRTAKNGQVENFYIENGFKPVTSNEGPERAFFTFDLERLPARDIGHFAEIQNLAEAVSA